MLALVLVWGPDARELVPWATPGLGRRKAKVSTWLLEPDWAASKASSSDQWELAGRGWHCPPPGTHTTMPPSPSSRRPEMAECV